MKARTVSVAFAMVTVEAEEKRDRGSTVELAIGEVMLRIGPEVTPARITEIVQPIQAA